MEQIKLTRKELYDLV